MATPDQNHPTQAPKTASSYERAQPSLNSPTQGVQVPQTRTPEMPDASGPEGTKPQDKSKRSGDEAPGEADSDADSDTASSPASRPLTDPDSIDHSMLDEEPDGWDLAPNDIHDPERKRHPRTEGKGGLDR